MVLTAAACSSDPTTTGEYQRLASEKADVEADLAGQRIESETALQAAADEMQALDEDSRGQLADSQAETTAAKAAASEASTQFEGERVRADGAGASATRLSQAVADLTSSLDTTVGALSVARDLAAASGADILSGDPAIFAEQSPDLQNAREELASTIGWFRTAEEYNLFESFRAFNRASGAIEDADVLLLLDAWDRYWDSPPGSEEEAIAFAEWLLRHTEQIVVWIDEATASATADRISPEA